MASGKPLQFQNGQVSEAVILLVPRLLVEIVLKDGDVGWVVPICVPFCQNTAGSLDAH